MSDFLLNLARRAAGIPPVAAVKPAVAPEPGQWAGPDTLEETVEETPASARRAEPAGETVSPRPPPRVGEAPVSRSADPGPVVPRPTVAAEPAGLERSVRVDHVPAETPRAVEGAATLAVPGGVRDRPAGRARARRRAATGNAGAGRRDSRIGR
jgi:hypothetical protein